MNLNSREQTKGSNVRINVLLLAAVVAVSSFLQACGGDAKHSGQTTRYPAGSVTSEDLDKQLKFDARVIDHREEDNRLVVEVSQAWVASPTGIKERSLSHWYSLWQAVRGGEGKGIEVVVEHEGEPVAKWTAAHGYELVEKKKAADSQT